MTALSRMAAALLFFVAAGLVILAGWQIVALAGADTLDPVSAIALIVLTLIGAVAVFAFGLATWRGRSWGRSGGVVSHLLVLAVALGAVTGPYPHAGTAIGLTLPAVAGLILIFLAAREAHRDDAAPGSQTED